MVSMLLFWGMWQATVWIRYALLGAGAGFTVWYWSDRLLFQMSSENWPFMLVGTVLLLILVTICVTHPNTKTFFTQRETDDR